MQTIQTYDISERAMLAFVNVSQWQGKKTDKRITHEVHREMNMRRAGHWRKYLIAKDALMTIGRIVTAARDDHKAQTLPWSNDGGRILKASHYDEYAARMRQWRTKFEHAVSEFVANYPGYVDQARQDLNGSFNAADYPDPADIERKFRWRIKVLPLPTANDFRVQLTGDQTCALKRQIECDMQETLQAAMREPFERLHEVVQHMSDKLRDYKPGINGKRAAGVFRDSLIENVKAVVECMPALNLADDPAFTAIYERARDNLCEYDADALRDDPDLRKEIADEADAIMDRMSAFM